MKEDVSIVITTHRYPDTTIQCIDDIVETECLDLDIIVVDDYSYDDSVERIQAKHPQYTYLKIGPVGSICEMWNTGIKRAIENGSNYICILNNDMRFHQKNWLTNLVATYEKAQEYEPINVVCPASYKHITHPLRKIEDRDYQELEYDGGLGWWFEYPLAEYSIIYPDEIMPYQNYLLALQTGQSMPIDAIPRSIVPTTAMYGGCFVIRPSTIDKIGWFDESFCFEKEESDYSVRGWNKRMPVLINRTVHVEHYGGTVRQEGDDGLYTLLHHKARQLNRPIVRPHWRFIVKHLPQDIEILFDKVVTPYLREYDIGIHPISRYPVELR